MYSEGSRNEGADRQTVAAHGREREWATLWRSIGNLIQARKLRIGRETWTIVTRRKRNAWLQNQTEFLYHFGAGVTKKRGHDDVFREVRQYIISQHFSQQCNCTNQ